MEIYQKLWRDAESAFEQGRPQVDSHLSDKATDLRRGVTLILRPPPPVRARVEKFLRRLALICPQQYFYLPEEFHVTVLSIISGTELWRDQMPRLEAGRIFIKYVLRRQNIFKIKFCGVTASPSCVMIQGFPADSGLENLRDELRRAFAQGGLGDMLDRRYKVVAAHVTIMRFCNANLDGQKLVSFLRDHRETEFGEIETHELQLVFADWYASASTVQMLEQYHLRPSKQ